MATGTIKPKCDRSRFDSQATYETCLEARRRDREQVKPKSWEAEDSDVYDDDSQDE